MRIAEASVDLRWTGLVDESSGEGSLDWPLSMSMSLSEAALGDLSPTRM